MSYRITNKCKGCTLCAKSCPMRAIEGAPKEVHRIDPQRCVDCGVCGRLCAFGAVLDGRGTAAVRLPREQWRKPLVDNTMCAACSVCVENCPTNSLVISSPLFHGDVNLFAKLQNVDACVGCGICVQRCPVGAIWLGPARVSAAAPAEK